MKPKTLTDVLEALNHYKSHFRRDGLVPLEFSGLQALFPELESAPEVTSKWPEAWPFGNRQGVYFVFGSQARLLYIGKASMRHPVGARLSSWFQYAKPSGGCKVVHNGWSEPPRFIAVIAVPEGMAFEAPALEEFLIERLSPPDNVKGRVPVFEDVVNALATCDSTPAA
jgi:hypothetical protein